MKKNDLLLLAGTLAYSYLFYQQEPGLNFLVFSSMLFLMQLLLNPALLKNIPWIVSSIGAVASGVFVAAYGNPLSVLTNLISLSAMSAMAFNRKTSFIAGIFFTIFSVLGSIAYIIMDKTKKAAERIVPSGRMGLSTKALLTVAPLSIALLFFLMYRSANPLFSNLTENINLDFISPPWVFFTVSGFLVLYGLLMHKRVTSVGQWELSRSEETVYSPEKNTLMGVELNISHELFSGVTLLVLLNFILLAMNINDAWYLFGGHTLPEGMTYSEYVHQGTGSLIFSIILAITILLVHFRGNLNHHPKARFMKMLAYFWILQNIFMIVSTGYRNDLYIQEYSLTYKRIGVYVWLLLTVIGLVFTGIKMLRKKSDWFLIRRVSWAFYIVMLGCSCISWDKELTRYNLETAAAKNKKPDIYYLLTLSDNNLPELMTYYMSHKKDFETTHDTGGFLYNELETERNMLWIKTSRFIAEQPGKDWQSWTKTDLQNEIELRKLLSL
jgi:hypothetical protein